MEELLKQLIAEVQEMKSNMATKQDFAEIKQSITRIENDQGKKISALFDAREVQFDVNERICDSLNRLEGKLDRISLKVSSHETYFREAK
ncbi:stress response protein SCP2 [Sporomusaceae bacterium BoRhaA]|uniref:hypothetical protein n=1 Tax=Pelorhabdus rhamnosifermentans TaxID=2772457 RepID=UPI001C0629AF|nr:hypothetical protein [Pelorhabdus rhamnosifermentans]MBU2701654.1 stress response protein SCP2 [Pelorhabdus rhamnosifermentans]